MWSEPMLKSRIDLEHGTWVLPGTGYAAENGEVKANEPTVAGKPVSEFVDYTLDRLCCFVEELSSHCLRRKMPGGVTLIEIPVANRVRGSTGAVSNCAGGRRAARVAHRFSPVTVRGYVIRR